MSLESDQHLARLFLAGRPRTTRRAYERDLGLFFKRLGKPLDQVAYEDLANFIEGLTGADATRARRASTIRSLLGFGHRLGHLRRLPFPPTPRPRGRLHEKILDEDEVRLLFAELQPGRDRCLARVLYAGGLRISEALGLRWRDVGAHWVTVFGKGARTRTVRIPDPVVDEMLKLRTCASPDAHVFQNSKGQSLSASYVRRIVRRAGLEAVGKAVSPHWLRHCHASHALDHGAPIHVLAHDMGHASIQATLTYLHVRPGEGSSRYLTL